MTRNNRSRRRQPDRIRSVISSFNLTPNKESKPMSPQYRVKANCPDGNYEGIMSGHTLMWKHEGKDIDCILNFGIRGINVPVQFNINDGTVDERSVEVVERTASVKKDTSHREPEIAKRVIEVCNNRRWSLHWTARGAYLHLEASELIEAIRGKHGNPTEEAADVLIVLMSITQNAGIEWSSVLDSADKKLTKLESIGRYAGEEFEGKWTAQAKK